MASKMLLSLIFTVFVLQQINFSSGQSVKAAYWNSENEFPLTSIDSSLFSHLFCAFAKLDASTNQLTIPPENRDSFSRFTSTVQQKNPSVKTLLSIGGGNADKPSYASMASQPNSRRAFIDSSIRLARSNSFHGLDLDWEYPQTPSEMNNFGILLNEWKSAINTESRNTGRTPLLLTAAVYYSPQLNGFTYPIQSVARNLDWINVMSYDLHDPKRSRVTRAHAALFDPPNHYSGSDGIAAWIQAGFPNRKLVMGFPFYGYAYRLVNPNIHGLLAPASGPAVTESGAMGYNQIREFIVQNRARTVYNATVVADYCYSGTTWIGYDDNQSIITKVSFAKNRGLLGYFAWHVGVDYNWILSRAASQAWGARARE